MKRYFPALAFVLEIVLFFAIIARVTSGRDHEIIGLLVNLSMVAFLILSFRLILNHFLSNEFVSFMFRKPLSVEEREYSLMAGVGLMIMAIVMPFI